MVKPTTTAQKLLTPTPSAEKNGDMTIAINNNVIKGHAANEFNEEHAEGLNHIASKRALEEVCGNEYEYGPQCQGTLNVVS